MTNYPAFWDELEKIGEEKKDNKERLKRLMLTVVPGAAIGTGLGVGVGKLIRPHLPHVVRKVPPSLLARYAGPAIGMAGGAMAGLAAYRARKLKDFIDEGKRPQ